MSSDDDETRYEAGPPPPTDALDTVNPDFIQCRIGVFGHAWQHTKPKREGALVLLISRCTNCGTRRVKKMTTAGIQIDAAKYDHPEGYRVKSGKNIRKADGQGWRSRFIRNTLGGL